MKLAWNLKHFWFPNSRNQIQNMIRIPPKRKYMNVVYFRVDMVPETKSVPTRLKKS